MFRERINLVVFLNSLFFFLCAYFSLFFISRIAVAVSSSAFDIPVRLYFFESDFLIRSSDWSSDAVNAVFSTGPLLNLILGLILMIIYFNVITEQGILRILLAWVFILSFISFLGEVIIGSIMNLGFGYVIMYMFIMDTGRVVFTLAGGLILVIAGLSLSRYLMFIANIYFRDLRELAIPRFAIRQYIMPYFAGLAILQIIEIPHLNPFNSLVRLCGIVFLIPLFSRSLTLQDIYFEEDQPEAKINWFAGAAAIAMLLFYRIGFGIGIRI